MQIHELPSGTLSSSDVVAIDNGTSTRKVGLTSSISSNITANVSRTTISTTTISASNLTIPISNYSQYFMFVMEVAAQSWIDTYIWTTYAATKNISFGYNHISSARCDFSSTGFTFSNLALASGVSSFSVRVIGVKIPNV